MVTRGIEGDLAMGLNLSITCSESLPFVTPEEAQSEGRETFMRESRYRAQRAACGVWDVPAENRHFLDPVPSAVPVLMISGRDDPATPPQFGAEELRYLPNGRQIVVPGAGHFVEGACIEGIESAVLEGTPPKAVNASCVRKARRPPFYANVPGWLR
jgi:pimeloyl-ACP methyl ester carboxylesterase